MPTAPLVRLAAIGAVAGFFSTMFGVGGGIIVVPLLVAFAGFEAKRATATSLAAIVLTAVFGVLRYSSSGYTHWSDALLVGVPAVVGVVVGTTLQRRLSTVQLTYGFAVLMVVVAAKLALTGSGDGGLHPAGAGGLSAGVVAVAILLGVLAGVLSGFFGIGGGLVFVPVLVLGLGLGQHQATATSLAAMIPVALVGAWRQDRSGLVDRRAAIIVGLCSIPGVLVGVPLAEALSGATLRNLFALLLVAMAFKLVRDVRVARSA